MNLRVTSMIECWKIAYFAIDIRASNRIKALAMAVKFTHKMFEPSKFESLDFGAKANSSKNQTFRLDSIKGFFKNSLNKY